MHSTDVNPATLPTALRNIFLQWQSLAAMRRVPRLSDMRVHDLAASVDGLALSEVVRDAQDAVTDFRILFISTQLRRNSTPNLIGSLFSDLPGKGPGSRIWAGHHACSALAAPLRASFPYIGPNPDYAQTCDVLLPLADDADRLNFVLAGVLFLPADPQRLYGAD